MFDFRLQVFYSVATRLNFTKAANELFISQPAVTKHIKEIEQQYQCTLFIRGGNKIELTTQGKILLNYAEKIKHLYQELDSEIAFLNQENQGFLRIGMSTTAAQYVLPKYLAQFKKSFPYIELELHTGNTENIENLLTNQTIDLGIVEGKSKRSGMSYTPFLKDELVLCTQTKTSIKSIISKDELLKIPFVHREKGSGSLEIIASVLAKNKIKISDLTTEVTFENTESIKNYLLNSNTFAFLSISAIYEELQHNLLKIIDVEDVTMERYFYLISNQGENSKTSNLFINFINNHNF